MTKPRFANSTYPHTHPVLQQLRAERFKQNLTQIDLAVALGYAHSEISRIETQSRNIYFQRILDYANFLGYDLALIPKETSK